MPSTFPHITFSDFHCLTGSDLSNMVGLVSDDQIICSRLQRMFFHLHILSHRLKNGSFPTSDL